MNNFDEHREQLLLRYIIGELTGDELAEMESWLMVPENREQFETWKRQLERIARFRQSDEALVDVEKAWLNVQESIHRSASRPQTPVIIPFRSFSTKVLRYAAAVAAIVAMFYLIQTLNEGVQEPEITENQPPVQEIKAEKEHLAFKMEEGSSIRLKRSGSLKVLSSSNDDRREVELDGEAFFKVKRDTTKPFIVYSGDAVVRVLGTSFLVKNLPDGDVLVFVKEGRVLLYNKQQSLMDPEQFVELTRNETGILGNGGKAEKKKTSKFNLFSWFSGTLKFRDAQMNDVVKDLEDYFGIDIELTDPAFGTCKLTARFKDKSVEEVMESLKLTFDIDISLNEGRYIISGKGC